MLPKGKILGSSLSPAHYLQQQCPSNGCLGKVCSCSFKELSEKMLKTWKQSEEVVKLIKHKMREKFDSRSLFTHSEEDKQIGVFNVASAHNVCALMSEKL